MTFYITPTRLGGHGTGVLTVLFVTILAASLRRVYIGRRDGVGGVVTDAFDKKTFPIVIETRTRSPSYQQWRSLQ